MYVFIILFLNYVNIIEHLQQLFLKIIIHMLIILYLNWIIVILSRVYK